MCSIFPFRKPLRVLLPGVALLAILSLAGIRPALAQTFTVGSSTPAHGSAGVALTTQVRFDFELPQDGRTWSVYEVIDFNTALRVEPRNAVRRTTPQLLLNDTGRPGVITYELTHQPNTDYTWLVYDVRVARPGGGGFVTAPLTEPYVLRYTTAATIGERTVRGTVVGSVTGSHDLPAATRRLLHEALASVRAEDDAAAGKRARPQPLHASVAERDVTHVYLLSGFTTAPRTRRIQAATVMMGETGPYAVEYVRPGVYWPVAVQFEDVYQTRIAAMAYYDANGDQRPDSIAVNATDRADITLTRVDFAAVDASAYLDQARAEASALLADAQLYRIEAGPQAQPDGTAYTWTYTFATPDLASGVAVEAGPLGTTHRLLQDEVADPVTGEPVGSPTGLNGLLPLPEAETRASEAAAIALDAGGAAFLQAYAPSNVQVLLEASHRASEAAPTFGRPTWRVRYLGAGPSGTQVFERFVDLETTGLVTSVEPVDEPREQTRGAAYPNPFREQVTLRFNLADVDHLASAASIEIYDLLGRRVRRVHASATPADRFIEAIWDGRDDAGQEVSAGVYLVRLDGARAPQTQRVTRMR